MEQHLLASTLPSLTQVSHEAYSSAYHMLSEHLLVGDWRGFRKGILDYFINQVQLIMFHLVFTVCYLYTSVWTILLNDDGVNFIRCYKNFP